MYCIASFSPALSSDSHPTHSTFTFLFWGRHVHRFYSILHLFAFVCALTSFSKLFNDSFTYYFCAGMIIYLFGSVLFCLFAMCYGYFSPITSISLLVVFSHKNKRGSKDMEEELEKKERRLPVQLWTPFSLAGKRDIS